MGPWWGVITPGGGRNFARICGSIPVVVRGFQGPRVRWIASKCRVDPFASALTLGFVLSKLLGIVDIFSAAFLNLDALKLFDFEFEWLWNYAHEKGYNKSDLMVVQIPSCSGARVMTICVFVHLPSLWEKDLDPLLSCPCQSPRPGVLSSLSVLSCPCPLFPCLVQAARLTGGRTGGRADGRSVSFSLRTQGVLIHLPYSIFFGRLHTFEVLFHRKWEGRSSKTGDIRTRPRDGRVSNYNEKLFHPRREQRATGTDWKARRRTSGITVSKTMAVSVPGRFFLLQTHPIQWRRLPNARETRK